MLCRNRVSCVLYCSPGLRSINFDWIGSGAVAGSMAGEATISECSRKQNDARISSDGRGKPHPHRVLGSGHCTSQVNFPFVVFWNDSVETIKKFRRYVRLLAISQPDLDQDFYNLATHASAVLDKMHPGGKIIAGVSFFQCSTPPIC